MEGGSGRPAHVLVLGAGPAPLGLLEAARARGLFVVAVDRDPGAPGFPLADRRALVSTEDEPAIQRLAEAERVDGVIAPGTDWPVAIAARVAQRLALPHPIDAATALLATSKARQRERFVEAEVPHVPWRHAANGTGDVPLPCVVKASDRQGQRGMSIVRDRAELAQAIALATAESRTGAALIEELVEGPEVTVNGISLDGGFHEVAVTDRVVADAPAFGVALAHVWPSHGDEGTAAPVAARAAQAIGIRDGPSYTQLRVGSDGPRVVELAARLGGGHDGELCHAAVGVDLNALALKAALGEEIRPEELVPRARVGGACTVFLVAPPGRLRAVHGMEQARAVDGVIRVRVYPQPGHEVRPLRHGADRAGAVLAVGENADEALARGRRAADLVRFETADATISV